MATSEHDTRARVRLNCWGDFGLIDSTTGADLRPRSRKTRALLAYLALHPGKPISRDRIAGLLWGGRGEDQARSSLRQAVWELKQLSAAPYYLVTITRDHLALDPNVITTDQHSFRRAAERGDYEALLDQLPDHDERLFENLDNVDEDFDDWLTLERRHHEEALITLISDASASALASGHPRAARLLHERLTMLDPSSAELNTGAAPILPKSAVKAVVPRDSAKPVHRFALFSLAASLLLVLVLGLWLFNRNPAPASTSIAVLPFTSSPGEDASFADGLSQEIMAQLARQPGLHVAGQTSSEQFRGHSFALSDVGRKLHVTYVLEGNVRSDGNRVRVTVALTKARDGFQLWSQTFDSTLDDVLAIQDRIGASVADALNVTLSPPSRATSNSLKTSGRVYSLYLTARGLIRERNGPAFLQARAKLQEAVRLDPNFAPAWSSLAQTENPDPAEPGAKQSLERAIGHAQKALALAPDFADAHAVLGMLYGFDDARGMIHIERAAALDPNNSEFQFWLGHVLGSRDDYGPMLAAYRRAYQLDPLWSYAQEAALKSAWQMGHRDEALSYLRSTQMDGTPYQSHMLRAALAEAQGDFSLQASELAAAEQSTSDKGKSQWACGSRVLVLNKVGLFDEAYKAGQRCFSSAAGPPPQSNPFILVRRGKIPSRAELLAHDQQSTMFWEDIGYMGRATKVLINHGRSADVLALYDGRGVMRMSRTSPPALPARLFDDGPLIAIALRSVGRNDEANRILYKLDRDISAVLKRNGNHVRPAFLANAAQTWALLGRADAACGALEQALSGGWSYVVENDDSSLPDFGDEPAFRALRGQPRFEAIRNRLNGNVARERREILAQISA